MKSGEKPKKGSWIRRPLESWSEELLILSNVKRFLGLCNCYWTFKGANDWECVDKNLQKLKFGVVFAEVNECCSTKQSFYACIRQHLLDEETNICYITLGVLVDLINYFKRLNRWTNISGVFWVTVVVFLQLKLNICLRYSVRQFNFIITTAGCLEIELQESWTNTDFWGKKF